MADRLEALNCKYFAFFSTFLVNISKNSNLSFYFKALHCRAKSTFSEALLPSPQVSVDRSSSIKEPSLLEKFYEKFSRAPAPLEAAQLQRLSEFSEPELIQITQVILFSIYTLL